ncbi:MAG: stage II sporulation protein D [Oscillospiraceae bacterium]|nr:stage II sporulation protein D [Oscillospiraceae bacterium]
MKKTIFSILILVGFGVFLFTVSPQMQAWRVRGNYNVIPAIAPEIPQYDEPPRSERIANLMPYGKVSVYVHSLGEVVYLDFEEYILGVVAAEMPASFEIAALQAQAIAARSFILYRMQIYRAYGAPSEHHGADSCTNFAHCVAWTSMEAARERWGDRADYYEPRLRYAVESTVGAYMTYNGHVARAFFFAMSSGRTENSEDVWSAAIPYLRSVHSGDYYDLPNFQTYAQFSVAEFVERLRAERAGLLVGHTLSEALGEITRTDGGRVGSIRIGNESFRGTEIRRIFGLRSHNFEVSTDDWYVYFTVRGFGHGVGMSQHGANRLARDGLSYSEILKTYYSGVDITR